jgi:hypothetical protein
MPFLLLGGKVEGNLVGLQDLGDGHSGGIGGGVTNGEGNIAEPKGLRLHVGAALAVLHRVEKEEESHNGQIGDGFDGPLLRQGS